MGGSRKKIANTTRKKYDHRIAQARLRLMLPYFTLRRGPALSINTALAIHTSLPLRVISRRMKIAATARIGTMNSDTLAPSGMSLPSIPTRNAQVGIEGSDIPLGEI